MTWSELALFYKPLVAGILLGTCAPLIGRHMVLGRAILLGLAVPQISLAGIAFVFMASGLGWSWARALPDDASRAGLGALLFTLPAMVLPALLGRRRENHYEGWLALIYLLAFAATNLMTASNAFGEMYIEDLFHGRMLLIGDRTLWLLGGTLAAAMGVVALCRRRILLVLTDPEFAAVSRVRVGAWQIGIAAINASVISVSVSAVGPNVTFAFLILPVLAAASCTRSLRTHAILSSGLGLLMAVAGFFISYHYDWPMGDTVVVAGAALVIATLAMQNFGRR